MWSFGAVCREMFSLLATSDCCNAKKKKSGRRFALVSSAIKRMIFRASPFFHNHVHYIKSRRADCFSLPVVSGCGPDDMAALAASLL